MKTLILAFLLLIATAATAQSPAAFAEKFIIYTDGSILVERDSLNISSLAVKMPSYYDQELIVSKMKAHLAKHPEASYLKTWRLDTEMTYVAQIMYKSTLMMFMYSTETNQLYIIYET